MNLFADKLSSLLATLVLLAVSLSALPAQAQHDATAVEADDKALVFQIKPRCRPAPGILRVPCQYKKIQNAINAAVNGDKILVNAGVYKGLNQANLLIAGKSITLECKGAPGSCVIDAEDDGRALNLAVTASLIRGFKFINGETNSSNPPAAQGGAVYSSNSAAVFDQCTFEGNEAAGFNSAGGAYSSFSSSDSIINSLLVANIADIGSAIHMSGGGNMLLRNSTVSANVAGGNFLGAITVNQINTAMDIRSSIVWGNLPAQNEVINNSGLVDANYSIVPADVLPNLGGTGSFSFDPKFTDPATGNYRPDSSFPESPAINNGDPNFVAFSGEKDLDDSCRKWCGQVDMGAYEDPTCTNFQQWPATDTPLAIPDGDPAGVESSVFVSGFGTITVTGVYVSLDHPSLSQLRVYLVAPDGTEDQLCAFGCFSQFYTVTNDFLGKDIHGSWTLRVEDPVTGSVGNLDDWRLDLEYTTPSCQL